MANVDAPNGLTPVSPRARVNIYTAGSSALAKGDVVGINPTTKVIELFAPITHGFPFGVMAHACGASEPAYVYDDPATEYRAQFDGTFNATTSIKAFDFKGTTGIMEIDGSNTIYGSVFVVDQIIEEGSPSTGADAKVRCRLAPYQFIGTNAAVQRRMLYAGATTVETLSGTRSVTLADGDLLKLDPGGAHRAVGFGAQCEVAGYRCTIANAADAAENLTIKDSAAATICVINQNEGAILAYTGAAWRYVGFTHVVDMSS